MAQELIKGDPSEFHNWRIALRQTKGQRDIISNNSFDSGCLTYVVILEVNFSVHQCEATHRASKCYAITTSMIIRPSSRYTRSKTRVPTGEDIISLVKWVDISTHNLVEIAINEVKVEFGNSASKDYSNKLPSMKIVGRRLLE